MLVSTGSKRCILRCGPLTAERILRERPDARGYMPKHGRYVMVVLPKRGPTA